ncbi:MAG: hypothetical protein E7058_01545 [Lentisphaerae bacterium]|nr:hypothetical protein [Lentisphaerota bacterium]
MKVFNIIACVIILLLAMASAVFSYFLYEKRVQFVDGWQQMTTAIQTSAKKIDEQGSKKYAKELTVDKLSHKTYSQDGMQKQLKNLTTQSSDFVKQYENAMAGWDALAKTLAENARQRGKYLKNSKVLEAGELAFEADNSKFSAEDFGSALKRFIDQNNEFVKQYEDAMKGWQAFTRILSSDAKKREAILKQGDASFSKLLPGELTFDPKNFNIRTFQEKLRNFAEQNDKLISEYNTRVRELEAMTADRNEWKRKYEAMTADRNKWKKDFEDTSRVLAQTKRELNSTTQQRNVMARYYATIGNRVNANAGAEKDFVNVNTYQGRLDRVSQAVNKMVANRDNMIKEMERISGKKLDSNAIFANVRKGLTPFETQYNIHKTARQKYAGAVAAVAARHKVAFKDDATKSYSATDSVIRANNKELDKIPVLQNQLATAHRNIGNLNNTVDARNKEISKLNGHINDYRTILELKPEDAHPKAWERGSVDARAMVVGEVTKVSAKYGYVVLNIGADTEVIQTIGNKNQPVNPDLEGGLTFNVTRNGEFIATVTLSNIGAKESTAHIPADKADIVKVGDKVTFKK